MIIAILCLIVLNHKRSDAIKQALKKGASGWVMPLISLTVIIGYGAVVKNTQGFIEVVHFASNLPGSTYVSAFVATLIIAGITGSSTGGVTITLDALASTWLATGANPAALHRIISVSSGVLDSLPHAGGLYTTLEVCGETIKSSYKHTFWVTVVIPMIASIVIVILANLGIV